MPFPLEPFRMKVVEQIRQTSREERGRAIKEAGFNVFLVPSELILIDMLTDSGTSAMSQEQWAGIMTGDEAYAQCRNWFHLEAAVREVFGYRHVIPCHQGRAAENYLFENLVAEGQLVISNTHFDTTRAQVQHHGGVPTDLIVPEGKNPADEHPFKGNIDLAKAERVINEVGPKKIAFGFLTVTNNSGGGQPVSLANSRGFSALLRRHGIATFFDAARYAENCYFIKIREKGCENKSVKAIAAELFSLGDGAWMSAKKDALVNIGGFVAVNDEELAQRVTNTVILNEGFATYGGMAGRDLEALARGLLEGLEEDYLAYRIGQVAEIGRQLTVAGVPIIRPTGGHAVYLDAKAILPHIPQSRFPGTAFTTVLYREFGIRGVEIGSLMFAEPDPNTGEVRYPDMELVRLCVPRRVYTASHLQYVVDSIIALCGRASEIKGLELVYAAPTLRHFTARFKEVDG
jgi:tyrosine phenol-lyase